MRDPGPALARPTRLNYDIYLGVTNPYTQGFKPSGQRAVRLTNYGMSGPSQVDSPRPTPFRTFIVKIHQRCNLRCDYCYVYQLDGDSWRSRPRVISRSVIDELAFRIGEHATAHKLTELGIVLHGGEPLLAGPEVVAYTVHAIRAALGHRRVNFSIQTNGLLLNGRVLKLFAELDLKVGLSLDGDMEMHDRHRRLADGSGSYSQAAAAASLLSGYPSLFSGILGVIDLQNDPVRTYEALARFRPPVIDFLLPHGNWSAPPPGRPIGGVTAPYADWLTAVFDHWYSTADGSVAIRLFDEIIGLLLGGASTTEEVGLSPVAIAVIETDGTIALSDVFQSATDATGLNVARDAFDAALRTPRALAVGARASTLSAQCRACPVGQVCGGGLYAHRYRSENEYDNPSVYCADLYRLINHIRSRLAADLLPLNNGD